jgi:hypothetical protein
VAAHGTGVFAGQWVCGFEGAGGEEVTQKKFHLGRTKTNVCVRAVVLGGLLCHGWQLDAQIVSDVDAMMERARTTLLAELKQADRYRVAHRMQYPELEAQMYGFTPRKLNFDEPRLHRICEGIAQALFKEQHRVTSMPPPTAWVLRDGEAKVRKVLESTYPDCHSNAGFGNSEYEGKRAADRLKTEKLAPETRVYRFTGGTVFLDTNVAKVGNGHGVVQEEHYLYASLYMGRGVCPVRKTGGGVGTQANSLDPADSALMRIDGRAALVERFTPNAYTLGYFVNMRGEDVDEEKARKDPQRLLDRLHAYPTDQPSPEDKLLQVYLPPFSPLTPPIASKDNAWVEPDFPDGSPEKSLSFAPSCYIYIQ